MYVPIGGREVDKLTNKEYDQLSKKADEKIRRSKYVSPGSQKQIKSTRIFREENEK